MGIVAKEYYLFYCDECGDQAKGVRANPTRVPWRLDPRAEVPTSREEVRLICNKCACNLGLGSARYHNEIAKDKAVLERIFGRRDW